MLPGESLPSVVARRNIRSASDGTPAELIRGEILTWEPFHEQMLHILYAIFGPVDLPDGAGPDVPRSSLQELKEEEVRRDIARGEGGSLLGLTDRYVNRFQI